MDALLLGFKHLARNRKRSSIALVIVGFGVVATLLAGGFIEWIFWAMREATIQSQLGHIQVVRPGYVSAGAADPFAFLLPGKSPIPSTVESTPGIKAVAPRLAFNGLISHNDTTVSFIGAGVDATKESHFTGIRITAGRGLIENNSEVILGRGLARDLGIKPGATVVLLVNLTSGGINAVELSVAGLFRTASKAYEDSALRVPIETAQELLRLQGSHAWLILLDKTDDTAKMIKQLRARFPKTEANVEFVPWYERAEFYNKTVLLFSRQMFVVQIIIALIIILSISNMLVMNVLERTGEIGTLMAIGLKRRKILQQFVSEGVILGIIGATVGLALGFILAQLISAIGIPMPPPPGMEKGYTGEIQLTWSLVLKAFLLATITTTLAGLYPAWKASRLEVVNALRHNR